MNRTTVFAFFLFSLSILIGTTLGSNFKLSPSFIEQKILETEPEIPDPNCRGTGWKSLPNLDTKCYKLIPKFANQKYAQTLCAREKLILEPSAPVLASIKSALEEEALVNYVFKQTNLYQNVWTGGQRSPSNRSQFFWADNTSVDDYTNWAPGFPTLNPLRGCIQLESGFGSSIETGSANNKISQNTGRWKDVTCELNNYVLCEKEQHWSMKKMQNEIMEIRKKQTELLSDALPVGFIYVQLSRQTMPQVLWPQFTWVDVSVIYKSAFFRVAGSKSGKFGSIQEESAPFIEGVQYDNCRNDDNPAPKKDKCKFKPDFEHVWNETFSLSDNGWSKYVISSHRYNSGNEKMPLWVGGIRFNRKYAEVRPENMAVKVWRRVR